MSTQNIETTTNKPADAKDSLTAGIILVAIGVGLLVFQWVSLEQFFTLVLGLIFIISGIVTRKAGLLIPGGIIGGVGLGIVALESGRFAQNGTVEGGAVFLLAMSLGWFSIILLSKLFTTETQVWPVFPGGAMALISGLMLMGENGLRILETLGKFWPLILVVIGLSTLYKWWKTQK